MKPFTLIILLIVACGVGCKKDSPNLARGKELLLIDEVKSAVTEFKIAAKQNPENQEAKAMLLYALARQSDELDDTFEILPALWVMSSDLTRDKVPTEQRERMTKILGSLRQRYYENGVDTKDVAELAAVAEAAARFALTTDKHDKAADAAAMALAVHGEKSAPGRLCERLKAEKTEYVVDYLIRVGEPAQECLDAIVANPEALGRDRALRALSVIRAIALAADLYKETPGLRGFDEVPATLRVQTGLERSQEPLIADLSKARAVDGLSLGGSTPKASLRSLWSGDLAKGGFLLLEGWDPAKSSSVVRLYRFENGHYSRGVVQKEGAEATLQSDRPTVRFRSSEAGTVELVRSVVQETEEQVRGARAGRAPAGTRVFVDRVAVPGVVVGFDQFGLATIRLDQPVSGETELQVPSGVLSLLKTVKNKQQSAEVVTLKYEDKAKTFDIDTGPTVTAAAFGKTDVQFGVRDETAETAEPPAGD